MPSILFEVKLISTAWFLGKEPKQQNKRIETKSQPKVMLDSNVLKLRVTACLKEFFTSKTVNYGSPVFRKLKSRRPQIKFIRQQIKSLHLETLFRQIEKCSCLPACLPASSVYKVRIWSLKPAIVGGKETCLKALSNAM